MSLTLTRPPMPVPQELVLPDASGWLVDAAPAAPARSRPDIVEEWGMQSFPASDPPSNW